MQVPDRLADGRQGIRMSKTTNMQTLRHNRDMKKTDKKIDIVSSFQE